jgi:zinc-ribbon domain
MNCRYCGAPLNPDVKFCSICGRSVQDEAGGMPPVTPPADVPRTPPFLSAADASAQTGRWIGAGWDLVKSDLLPFVLMALVFLVVNSCIPLVLQGPMMAGFHIACIRKLMAGRTEVGDLFKAFNRFGATLVAFLIITVFTSLASLLCLIPGLIVWGIYQFTFLFVVDKKMDFWPAMQASHALVKKDYLGFTLFSLVLLLINVAGALLCLVGLLLTVPLYYAAITAAYRDLVGFENKENF